MNPLFSEFEARENEHEIAKSLLLKKLHHIEGLTETGHEFIATSLAHFTTEKTTTKVLEDLKNRLLSESDLRIVFVLNAELNGDLIKEVLRAGKNNSVIFYDLHQGNKICIRFREN